MLDKKRHFLVQIHCPTHQSSFATRIFTFASPTGRISLPDSWHNSAAGSHRSRWNLTTHWFAWCWHFVNNALEVSHVAVTCKSTSTHLVTYLHELDMLMCTMWLFRSMAGSDGQMILTSPVTQVGDSSSLWGSFHAVRYSNPI